jgi:NAD(P)-dependent dehydrogenase (short-subunit alcohol dehydrogenase family)
MASQAALVGLDGHVGYAATKAGLLGMTRVWALEWGGHGITANAISPTVIETPLAKSHWVGEIGAAFKAKIPVGRFGEERDLDGALLLLVSDAGRYIAGTTIVVDGGQLVGLRGSG